MAKSEEAEVFAAQIRALKNRAGVSFEALARQTGVSGSSLHRYCSGAKVPTGYGVVHRFGKACGGSSEELRELHRLWALADAARSAGERPGEAGEDEAEDPSPDPSSTTPGPPFAAAWRSRCPIRRRAFALTVAVMVVGTTVGVAVGVAALVTAPGGSDALATRRADRPWRIMPVRVFDVDGDCESPKKRIPACGMSLAVNPRLTYDRRNVVSHRVWHGDVLDADCVLYDGIPVEGENGVKSTDWFRVRLADVPGGFAWLPAMRTHDFPRLPTCPE